MICKKRYKVFTIIIVALLILTASAVILWAILGTYTYSTGNVHITFNSKEYVIEDKFEESGVLTFSKDNLRVSLHKYDNLQIEPKQMLENFKQGNAVYGDIKDIKVETSDEFYSAYTYLDGDTQFIFYTKALKIDDSLYVIIGRFSNADDSQIRDLMKQVSSIEVR